jgi:hypothetical protein
MAILNICRNCRECIPHAKIEHNFGCIQHLKQVKLADTCDRFLFVGHKYMSDRKNWSD